MQDSLANVLPSERAVTETAISGLQSGLGEASGAA
jgi:hypothetical protein